MIETHFIERDAAYYDRFYEEGYSTASYAPVYEAVIDFLLRMPDPRVLEVGCGIGDLAARICLEKIPYRGFDVSPVAIDQCRTHGVRGVSIGSAYDARMYAPKDFNVIVALEVFEHIDDLRAIAKFPRDLHVLFSVPDFVETSHLRAYQDPQSDIVEYYAGQMAVGGILPFTFESEAGTLLTIYLAHAVVGDGPCTNPLARTTTSEISETTEPASSH